MKSTRPTRQMTKLLALTAISRSMKSLAECIEVSTDRDLDTVEVQAIRTLAEAYSIIERGDNNGGDRA